MRRAAHEGLNPTAAHHYHPVQEREAAALVQALISSPQFWDSHVRRCDHSSIMVDVTAEVCLSASASMVLSAIYDLPPLQSNTDPMLSRINEFVERLVKSACPGAHLVEFFTWLNYLPACVAPWKKRAQLWYAKDSALLEGLYNDAVARSVSMIRLSLFTLSNLSALTTAKAGHERMFLIVVVE
jgi:hypothetical protein